MTTEPFIPHADSIQTAWVLMCQQSRIATQPPVEELEAEFDRFLAKVKRTAAREALDGLSAWLGDLAEKHPARSAHVALMQGHITRYTTDNYPEETPWPCSPPETS